MAASVEGTRDEVAESVVVEIEVAGRVAGVDVLKCQSTSIRKKEGTAIRMARRARIHTILVFQKRAGVYRHSLSIFGGLARVCMTTQYCSVFSRSRVN